MQTAATSVQAPVILSPIARFRRLLALDKSAISEVYIYAFFNGVVTLTLPLGIQAIVNFIQGGEVTTAWIVLVSFVIGGVVLSGIMQIMQLRIVENLSQKIFSHASFEFAYRIPKIQYISLRDYYGPELANRFFDTMTIQKALPKILIDFSLALFQIIVGLILLSLYHSFFIIFSILLVILMVVIVSSMGRRGLSTSIRESSAKYKIAFWLEEVARNRMSFKLACDSPLNMTTTNEHVEKYLDARESHFKVIIQQSYLLVGFKVLITAGLLITGSILVFNQQMNIGQFVAAEIVIILIIASIEKLISTLEVIYDMLTGLEKIGYVFDKPLDNNNGLQLKDKPDSFAISVDNLAYKYENAAKASLQDINFSIPKNTSVLITGPSNSGKSTLLKLMSGILPPDEGIIHYNGLPLKSLELDHLRKDIGFALSNSEIFHGTILENISMSRACVDAGTITRALEITGLNEFLSTVPLGLKTFIDPEGEKIPRNIHNRILLARAIAAYPRMLILEDPLDHVRTPEKREIIRRLTAPSNPWRIIVTSVDDVWKEFIPNQIVIKDGHLISNTLKQ